jgi:hypothetical protein
MVSKYPGQNPETAFCAGLSWSLVISVTDRRAEGEGQQIPQRYRTFRHDRVFQWPVGIGEHGHVRQLLDEVVDRVIEAEGAVLDERHRARGDDRLRHRGHATDRVARHGRPRPCALEREIAGCFDVHLAVAGEDGQQ